MQIDSNTKAIKTVKNKIDPKYRTSCNLQGELLVIVRAAAFSGKVCPAAGGSYISILRYQCDHNKRVGLALRLGPYLTSLHHVYSN